MAERKPRAKAKSKEQPKTKPLIQLDPERWEEIAAIVVFILAALTALAAFNLSGGILLTPWVQFLQMLLGWGVYFAPLLLLGLGLWLFFDALDRIVNIGWERPIGLGLFYLWLVAVLHWVNAFEAPTKMPSKFEGGGLLGWAITSILVQAFGSVAGAFALLAIVSIALILLFNISLPEIVRRVVYLGRIIPNLPREIQNVSKKQPAKPMLPSGSTISPDRPRAPASPPTPLPPPPPTENQRKF